MANKNATRRNFAVFFFNGINEFRVIHDFKTNFDAITNIFPFFFFIIFFYLNHTALNVLTVRKVRIKDQEPNRGSLVLCFQFLKTYEDNCQIW